MVTALVASLMLAAHLAAPPTAPAPPTTPAAPAPATPAAAAPRAAAATACPEWVSKDTQPLVARAIERAGTNSPEIQRALHDIEPDMRDSMAWLVATMPEHDLRALNAAFLLSNVRLATRARREAPWGKDVPEELFRQYVLPYCSLNERRDDWRQDFFDRFHAEAWKFTDPIDAVKWINDNLPDRLNVHFSADKRKKPDQSPYESMELSWASCTGLSILVVDACRAVGIPARIVGCPAWKTVQGNHNWVEVWWNRWYNVGDSGSDPRGVDWVEERCRTETDPDDWVHAVYASVWRPTNVKFPLVWAFEIEYVPAVNVTRFYSAPVEHPFAVSGGGPAELEVRWAGELVARARAGADGKATLPLARGNVFEVVIARPDGTRTIETVKP